MIDSYSDEKIPMSDEGGNILKVAQNLSLDLTHLMVMESCIDKKISFFI